MAFACREGFLIRWGNDEESRADLAMVLTLMGAPKSNVKKQDLTSSPR